MRQIEIPSLLGNYIEKIEIQKDHTDVSLVYGLIKSSCKRFDVGFSDIFSDILEDCDSVGIDFIEDNIINFLTGNIDVGYVSDVDVKRITGLPITKYVMFYHKTNPTNYKGVDYFIESESTVYISVEYLLNKVIDFLTKSYLNENTSN
jgi:hypothetical protein